MAELLLVHRKTAVSNIVTLCLSLVRDCCMQYRFLLAIKVPKIMLFETYAVGA